MDQGSLVMLLISLRLVTEFSSLPRRGSMRMCAKRGCHLWRTNEALFCRSAGMEIETFENHYEKVLRFLYVKLLYPC